MQLTQPPTPIIPTSNRQRIRILIPAVIQPWTFHERILLFLAHHIKAKRRERVSIRLWTAPPAKGCHCEGRSPASRGKAISSSTRRDCHALPTVGLAMTLQTLCRAPRSLTRKEQVIGFPVDEPTGRTPRARE